MNFKLEVRQIFEFGQRVDKEGKPHQEDCLYPYFGEVKPDDRLFILCDGMGGHDAGEVASATVCQAMSESVNDQCPDPEGGFTDNMLQTAIDAAFDALDAKDTNATKKMGTTMTFLKFHKRGATIAHMGDSRVYHIRPGKTADDTEIISVTHDHSLVNALVAMGEITEEEARTSSQKNVITKAMQPHMDRRPKADVLHVYDIQPGDYFFMCSDGMLEQMEDDNLRFLFSKAGAKDDDELTHKLTVVTGDNNDNHTAFIIRVVDVNDPDNLRVKLAKQAAEEAASEAPRQVNYNVPTQAPDNSMERPQSGYYDQAYFDNLSAQAQTNAPVAQKGESRNSMLYVFIAVALVAVIAVVCFFVFFTGDSKKDSRTPVETPRQETPAQTGLPAPQAAPTEYSQPGREPSAPTRRDRATAPAARPGANPASNPGAPGTVVAGDGSGSGTSKPAASDSQKPTQAKPDGPTNSKPEQKPQQKPTTIPVSPQGSSTETSPAKPDRNAGK